MHIYCVYLQYAKLQNKLSQKNGWWILGSCGLLFIKMQGWVGRVAWCMGEHFHPALSTLYPPSFNVTVLCYGTRKSHLTWSQNLEWLNMNHIDACWRAPTVRVQFWFMLVILSLSKAQEKYEISGQIVEKPGDALSFLNMSCRRVEGLTICAPFWKPMEGSRSCRYGQGG